MRIPQGPLPQQCLSVPACMVPRLPYSGYCQLHAPPSSGTAAQPGCVAPLRCCCSECSPRRGLGPELGPHGVAQVAAAIAEKRKTE